MCNDGAWLNGLSKPAKTANSQPNTPLISGRSNVNRRGQSKKQLTAISCALSRRNAWRFSSWRVRHSSREKPYNRSIDQYGTMVQAQNGTWASQANTRLGTSGRWAVYQVAKP
ncbi:hypothetical protein D3C86_1807190 [compost metagenome]